MFANNKIPAGFSKRENRREVEILISRFIDRAIRPTIDESFRFNINISCTVMSYSKLCPPEALAVTAASSALIVAGVPCNLVVGTCLNRVSNRWTSNVGNVNNLLLAGNYYGVSALEVCGEQLTQEQISEGLRVGSAQIGPLIDFVRQKIKKYKHNTFTIPIIESNNPVVDTEGIVKAYFNNQRENLNNLYNEFISKWSDKAMGKVRWGQIVRSVVRMHMLWTGKRQDGRDFESIRHTAISKDFIPSHHCLIARGKTKVLTVLTFSGSPNESQIYETLDQNENRKLLVHYNYHPDYRTNGQPQRREIGNGNLIRNAFKSLVSNDRFMRIANEVIRSDGGSCMASVLGCSNALQNAGIEIPTVYGLSIGLIMQASTYRFITDLNYNEGNISDISLDLAGTKNGITAVQLDSKIPFVPWYILEHSLQYGSNAILKGIKNLNKTDVNHVQQDTNTESEKNPNEPRSSDSYKTQIKNHEQKKNNKENPKIVLQLDEIQINRLIQAKVEDSDTHINETMLITNSANINKLLSIALDSSKEVFYSRVSKIVGDSVDLQIISNNTKIQIKKEAAPDLVPGQMVAISKGKFGRWVLITKLDKKQPERSG
jgi:polyribonucleotide nucleotidyltransferase